MTDKPFDPCRLIEHDEYYSLIYTRLDGFEVFQAAGWEGGGYSWTGVVDWLLRQRHPELVGSIRYDPEGSMFCALSESREVLEVVARQIREAVADPALLARAVAGADPEMMD